MLGGDGRLTTKGRGVAGEQRALLGGNAERSLAQLVKVALELF
jgi:hypothetical protein